MIALWILGGILLLIVLLLLLPVGVQIQLGAEQKICAQIGPFTCRLSQKNGNNGKPKREKRHKKMAETKQPSDKKKMKLTFADVRSGLPMVWQSLQRGLRMTRQKIKISPMQISLVFGGDDPAEVAEQYGWASSALWTVMPPLQKLVQIPRPQIHIGVDFNAPKIQVEGRLGLRCRVGGILLIALSFARPLLKWWRGYQKRQQQQVRIKQTQTNTKIA